MPEKKPELEFEQALKELQQLVEKMEQGDVSLEESLRCFERGIALTRLCQQALAKAEQKVKLLMQNAEGDELVDFAENGGQEGE